ncbi:hypothetical protein ACFQV2_03675 [Actinokineospora soli]|uniref:Uncharacterized protein n=1 Tax=Actinokineospora soli TaxID=1048753 RepID=A0ABW2TGJ8_9PSEU
MIEARRVLDDAAREVDRLNERIQRQWATARDRRLRAACQDMDLVTEFFAGTLRGELEPFTTFVRADAPYVERVQEVHDLVVELVAALEAIDTTPDDEERRALVDNLRQVAIRLRAGLRSTVDAYAAVVNAHSGNGAPDEPRYAALQFVADLRTQLRTRELIDGAERARAEWQILAGDRSAKTTADHYRLHADAERKRADLLRGVVAFLVVVITAGRWR